MRSLKVELAAASTTEEVVARVAALAADPTVHGILVQHPVPRHVDERRVFETVPSAKDVDGLTLTSFGGVSFGLPGVGYGSCTPEGIVRLLDAYQVELSGRRAVVIGRSPILGKPMAMMLLARDATVTICHSRTRDLGAIVAEADVVVAAVGKARVRGSGAAGLHPGAQPPHDPRRERVLSTPYQPRPTGSVHPIDGSTRDRSCSVGRGVRWGRRDPFPASGGGSDAPGWSPAATG